MLQNSVSMKEFLRKYDIAKNIYISNPDRPLNDIAKEVGINSHSLSKYLKQDGFEIVAFQNRKIDDTVFEVIDTEDKAYWLGFLYADGYVSKNSDAIELGLKISDIGHVEKFRDFMGLKNKISPRTTRIGEKSYDSCRLSFRSNKVKKDLIKSGCVPNKSLILKFPSDEIVPKELKNHFMRGYIDGDGCLIHTDKTRAMNIIGTEDFLVDFCKYFGLKVNKLRGVGTSGLNKMWQYYKNDIYYLLDLFYGNANVYLQRKYDIFLRFKNDAVCNRNVTNYQGVKSVKADKVC